MLAHVWFFFYLLPHLSSLFHYRRTIVHGDETPNPIAGVIDWLKKNIYVYLHLDFWDMFRLVMPTSDLYNNLFPFYRYIFVSSIFFFKCYHRYTCIYSLFMWPINRNKITNGKHVYIMGKGKKGYFRHYAGIIRKWVWREFRRVPTQLKLLFD